MVLFTKIVFIRSIRAKEMRSALGATSTRNSLFNLTGLCIDEIYIRLTAALAKPRQQSSLSGNGVAITRNVSM